VLAGVKVPGRLEPVANSVGAAVFVDYAHSEDGLEQVLGVLRALPHRRLYTVFGCGGDRDRGKRPRMGAVAGRLSDVVFLTTDNPRNEDPRAIIDDIVEGFVDDRNYRVVEDREAAIAEAVDLLADGDILLIAGKGHESVQIVGEDELPFSDLEIARKHLLRQGVPR
jgi:UDP-N-acetylmuramoyl-L-alanyl-D-glutamate--2,6-diaminopimelate ligase